METATITSEGQLTLPAEVRKRLSLRPGDEVRFEPMGDGGYRLLAADDHDRVMKAGSIRDLKGILARPGQRPATIEEMNEAIAEGSAEGALGRT